MEFSIIIGKMFNPWSGTSIWQDNRCKYTIITILSIIGIITAMYLLNYLFVIITWQYLPDYEPSLGCSKGTYPPSDNRGSCVGKDGLNTKEICVICYNPLIMGHFIMCALAGLLYLISILIIISGIPIILFSLYIIVKNIYDVFLISYNKSK